MNDEAPPDHEREQAPTAPVDSAADAPLGLDHAEFASEADAAPACSFCKRVLGASYFTINARIACEDCHHLVSTQLKESKGARAFLRAAGFGAAAALGGAVAWYAVAQITGMEIGLLAVAVGYAVGKAVRHGARGTGGRRYQALAMLLTYLSITGSYVPLVLKSVTEIQAKTPAAAGSGTPAGAALPKDGKDATSATSAPSPKDEAVTPPGAGAPASRPEAGGALVGLIRVLLTVVVVLGLSFVAPFLSGASNIIGIALIGIALYEAWKFNRSLPLVIDGPLRNKASGARAPSVADPGAAG